MCSHSRRSAVSSLRPVRIDVIARRFHLAVRRAHRKPGANEASDGVAVQVAPKEGDVIPVEHLPALVRMDFDGLTDADLIFRYRTIGSPWWVIPGEPG